MDPVDALTRLGGVAAWRDLERLTSRRRLRTAVGAGRITRVATGRYALPTAARSLTLAAAHGGHVSHLCAAAHHGWEIARQPELPQLVVPRHRDLPRGLVAEVTRLPRRATDLAGPVTGPLLTVLLCARDLSFPEALAVADSCLRHGAAAHDDLVAAATGWGPEVGRVAAYADARAANPFESVLRALAIEAGLDVVHPRLPLRARP
jgi:hypothetical protein